MFKNETAAFVERIHQEIPLTLAMGWQISGVDANQLIAVAPLLPNINDKGTFFGGASSALLTVSAWSLIKLHLEQMGLANDVVIHKSSNQWLRPQNSNLRINCSFQASPDWQLIKNKLIDAGENFHIKISCQASDETDITAVMKASFVVLSQR